jgi:uncharacterized protein
MGLPFVYGKIANEDNFANRVKELEKLTLNFNSGINTILISPRRWGKSSLVRLSAQKTTAKDNKIVFCFLDMYNIRSEEDFYQKFSIELLKSVSSRWEDIQLNIKRFFKQMIPKITYQPDNWQEFSIGLDWNEIKNQPDIIINLAEKIAEDKKIKIIVCLDEFQNISFFNDPLAFQKKLRANWQYHQHASYCLYGSKRHMMMEMFTSQQMPFYQFGDILFLEKISLKDWENFITKRYKETGKSITIELSRKIAQLAECHSFYVQQLAQICWLRSKKTVTEEIIDDAFQTLANQLGHIFQAITESLSLPQINYLKAILEGVEQFSSFENLRKYQLGSSSNITRIKDALINKEILDSTDKITEFLDPVFKYWLQTNYFKL